MDGLTLGFIARELQETLRDGRVEKVTQPEKDMLVLLVRAQGKNHRLLLSAAPAYPRVHLTQLTYQNPPDAPMSGFARCQLSARPMPGEALPDGDGALGASVASQMDRRHRDTAAVRRYRGWRMIRRWAIRWRRWRRRAHRPKPEVMPKSNAIYVVRLAFDGRANLV